jgi:CheY-like chemotaxis protein
MSQTLVLSVGSDPTELDTRDLILKSAGYIVVSVMSINEAVHLFQDGDFDLVILCQSLPIRDSERLTRFIRASGSRVPIVSVSGTALADRNAIVDATLDKDPAAFLEGLGDLLSRHAQMQPVGVFITRNGVEIASAKKPPRSSAGFERQNGGALDQTGSLGCFERTWEHVPSH